MWKIPYLYMACTIALQLPLWVHDDILTLYAPPRRLRIVWTSMFDDGALWLISGDSWGGSPRVKSNQGGIFKGKWFHINTPDFRQKRKQERDNQHFILDLASARRREKQVAGVRKARARWTWRWRVEPAELCLYEKPQKVSFMITALRERRWGWVLWRIHQSAAVGSSQAHFHNNLLIQKVSHIVITYCLAKVCTNPLSTLFLCRTILSQTTP